MGSPRSSLVLCLVAASLLTACGNAEQPKSVAPPAELGVFISTSDCVEDGTLTADQCAHAIDMAVALHNEEALIYKSLRQCEGAEGPERCDKTGDSEYRARLQAFYVVMSDPPTAVPLYPPQSASIGFRSPSKQTIDARDENIHVSYAAQTIAYENAKLPANLGDGGAGLGAAAANIH
jgi:Protein of unknown function (DUF1190)